jgi:23S rRNA (uracil1939-C5)-methyltransferase
MMDSVIEIKLDRLAYGGEAIGRLPDGRNVFVPFALPGERARVRIVEEKRGHARAELVEILEASPPRIVPRCIHYGVCGGCHYQHLSYPDQLQIKTEILAEQLRRIGGIEKPPLRPPVAAPQPFNYRNHVQFDLSPDGKPGYHYPRSDQVMVMSECHLPEAVLNHIWPQLEFEPGVPVERIGLRLGVGDDVQLILESSDPVPPEFDVEGLPISAVHLSPAGALVLAGSPDVFMEVGGRTFRVSADSFFQVNTAMAEKLVYGVLEGLDLTPGATVLDIYCGVGLFSAWIAPVAGRLIGIESSPAACEDFAVNLDEFDNVELYEAAAGETLPGLNVQADAVVVDPPRAGLERAALDGLLRLAAPRLVYVSCDPATLARDAKRLLAGGYRLHSVTPYDLFPQTYHIESLSVFER